MERLLTFLVRCAMQVLFLSFITAASVILSSITIITTYYSIQEIRSWF